MHITDYIYNISFFALLSCSATIFILAILPIKVSLNGILNIFKLLIISLSVFSFFAEPQPSTDLYRHYLSIDRNAVQGYNSALLIWRLMLWIVSLTHCHGFLPLMSTLIWGILVYRIIKKYINENEYSSRAVFLYLMSLFAGCGLFYIITGIRSTLVAAIIAYGYLNVRSNSFIKYIYLVIIGALIHTMALLLFLIIEAYHKFIKCHNGTSIFKTLVIVFVVMVLLNSEYTVNILRMIPGVYGRLLASKWVLYTEYLDRDTMENSIRIFYVIFFLLVSLVNVIKSKRVEFFDWLVFITVASMPMMIFFERLPYFIGILSIKVINGFFVNSKSLQSKICHITLYTISLVFLIFFIYTMFAHVSFNGHSYYEFLYNIRRIF